MDLNQPAPACPERSRRVRRRKGFNRKTHFGGPCCNSSVSTITAERLTLGAMSPTVLRIDGYRFFFFSREELRPHVHVAHHSGEAKVWLEPEVVVAHHHGFSARHLAQVVRLVKEHHDDIRHAWDAHFGR